MILLADSEGADAQSDLGLHCQHMLEDMFLHRAAQIISLVNDIIWAALCNNVKEGKPKMHLFYTDFHRNLFITCSQRMGDGAISLRSYFLVTCRF